MVGSWLVFGWNLAVTWLEEKNWNDSCYIFIWPTQRSPGKKNSRESMSPALWDTWMTLVETRSVVNTSFIKHICHTSLGVCKTSGDLFHTDFVARKFWTKRVTYMQTVQLPRSHRTHQKPNWCSTVTWLLICDIKCHHFLKSLKNDKTPDWSQHGPWPDQSVACGVAICSLTYAVYFSLELKVHSK